MTGALETEAGDVVLRIARPDRLEDPHRDEVLGLHQATAQRHRPLEAAVVVLGLPGLSAGQRCVEREGGVVDHGAGHQALLEGRGIDEGLEGRAGLPPRLGHPVELVTVEVEAADQRADRAVRGVRRDQRGLHLGKLRDLPSALAGVDDAHQGAAAQAALRRQAVAERGSRELQPGVADLDDPAVAAADLDRLRPGLDDHGGEEFLDLARALDRVLDPLFRSRRVRGQLHVALGAPVAMPPVVVEHALSDGGVRGALVGRLHGGVDVEAGRVDVLAEHLVGQLARKLRHVGSAQPGVVRRRRETQRFGEGLLVGGLREEARLEHPPQDVALALGGALGVDQRVVQGRRLGQPREHRGLCGRQRGQRLAEVDLRRGSEAVGPLAEEDLVQVELEDLVLAQALLDAQCEEDLVDLAGVRLLAGQEEVARHLHRDRARALVAPARKDVAHRGARDADRIDARMLEEARVLGRQDGVPHHRRNVLDAHEAAALLAELPDQHAVGGVDPQRDLGTVVGDRLERRQAVVGEQRGERKAEQPGERGEGGNRHHREQQVPPGEAARAARPGGTRSPAGGEGIRGEFGRLRCGVH